MSWKQPVLSISSFTHVLSYSPLYKQTLSFLGIYLFLVLNPKIVTTQSVSSLFSPLLGTLMDSLCKGTSSSVSVKCITIIQNVTNNPRKYVKESMKKYDVGLYLFLSSFPASFAFNASHGFIGCLFSSWGVLGGPPRTDLVSAQHVMGRARGFWRGGVFFIARN